MTTKNDDFGLGEIQKRFDEEDKQGFRGQKVDPLPNSAHSLESGPDAPPIHDVPAPEAPKTTAKEQA